MKTIDSVIVAAMLMLSVPALMENMPNALSGRSMEALSAICGNIVDNPGADMEEDALFAECEEASD